ncbi:MAG: TonB-dependent receptor [Flavobacteriales bacterium]|nr:TonB-dependent receptor [Flavobacteriales bacterium]
MPARGSNWADATFTDAYSYFIKIQKQFDKHLISLSANGSPQKHGMRYDRLPMAIYDKSFSDKLGINSDSVLLAYNQIERGRTYNPNWGSTTNDVAYMGNPFPDIGNGGQFNDRVNFYHKPQINLSHFWTPSDRWSLSTVAYLSIGKGGGTGLKNSAAKLPETGQLNVQSIYDGNTMNTPNVLYNATERPSTNYLRSNNNEHFWYGILSTANFKLNDNLNAMFGLDARSYKGSHFQTVYDLMGGDYTVDAASNANQVNGTYIGDPNFQNAVRHDGDTIGYHNDSFVKWGGLFGQIEYKKDRITAFLTGSISTTQYQRVDYYKKRDLVLDGEVFSQVVGNGDRFFYNGEDYIVATSTNVVNVVNDTTFITAGSNTRYIVNADEYNNKSPESRYASTDVKHFYGNTFKTGANFKINESQNVFMNAGILNMAPRMDVVFDNNNNEIKNTRNQHVYAVEGGYNFHNKRFAANLNAYYTRWDNKPPSSIPQVVTSDGTLYYNITGLNALHKGVELDFIYKLKNKFEFEGLLSWGDWRTTSGSTSNVTDDNGNVVAVIDFSAKNVHVGDAAQIQTAGSIRYEIIKNLYIKGRFTYFDKNYANFDPILLTGTNKDRESWKMPSYGLLDFFAGYDFTYHKVKFTATSGISNALDITYLTDAQNGTKFDATTATVFMGMGRRINFSLRISY